MEMYDVMYDDDDDGLGGQNLVWTADEEVWTTPEERDEVWATAIEVPGQMPNSVLFLDEDTSYVYRAKTKPSKWGRTYLTCRKKWCNASGIIRRDEAQMPLICQTRAHTHEPEENYMLAKQLRLKLYDRARTESTALSEIHRQELAGIHNEHVIASMTYARLQSSMQRQRSIVYPPLPKSLAEFCSSLDDPQYAERFGRTRDGKQYFRSWRSGSQSEGTVAIFVSEHFEHMLSQSECFQIDGHFKMCPNIPDVYQQVTIMPVSYDHVFPAVTILMTKKTKVAYKMAFQCLKEVVPNFRMPHVMTDYEKGLLQAIREEFPDAHLTGCLFHLDQAMCKKAAKIGLRELLKTNVSAGKIVRMCMALPFLPAEKIEEGFRAVRDYSVLLALDRLTPFLDYVENTWLLGVGPAHISVYRRHRRTNNDLESYHRTLTDTLGRPHPSPWCWLESLREHEAHHRRKLIAVRCGYAVSRLRKRKYRLLDRNIQNLSQRVDHMPVFEFLEAASYHCKATYSRVALREEVHDEDVVDEVTAPEPPTAPLLEPVEQQDPVEGLGAADEIEEQHVAAGRGRGRGRGRGARGAAGATRRPGRGGNRGGGGRAVAADVGANPGPGRAEEIDGEQDDPLQEPAEPGRGARGAAGRGAAGRPGRGGNRGGGGRAVAAVAADVGANPGAVRGHRRPDAEAQPAPARVTRQTPAAVLQREEQRVSRESRATQRAQRRSRSQSRDSTEGREARRRSNEALMEAQDDYNLHVQRLYENQGQQEQLVLSEEEMDEDVLRWDRHRVTREEYDEYNRMETREAAPRNPNDWKFVPRSDVQLTEKQVKEQVAFLAHMVQCIPIADRPAEEGEDVCTICTESVTVRTFVPCKHKVLCGGCTETFCNKSYQVQLHNNKPVPKMCPVCRALISAVI